MQTITIIETCRPSQLLKHADHHNYWHVQTITIIETCRPSQLLTCANHHNYWHVQTITIIETCRPSQLLTCANHHNYWHLHTIKHRWWQWWSTPDINWNRVPDRRSTDDEMLHGRRSQLRLKGGVYKSYVRPTILYASKAWCLKESEMKILQRTERSMVRAICGAQLKDRKRSTYMMFMLGLSETTDQLAMANSVHWYGHVLRRQDGHILKKALDFEVEGRRKKERPKRTWKKQVEEESVKIFLRRDDALCRSEWSVGINYIAAGLRWILPPSPVGDTNRF